MRKATFILAVGILLPSVSLIFAQEANVQPVPEVPSQVLGAQLILWSEAQKPKPMQQDAGQRSDAQPGQPAAQLKQLGGQRNSEDPAGAIPSALSTVVTKSSRP